MSNLYTISIKQAAKSLKVSQKTIRRRIKKGELKAKKKKTSHGLKWFIHKDLIKSPTVESNESKSATNNNINSLIEHNKELVKQNQQIVNQNQYLIKKIDVLENKVKQLSRLADSLDKPPTTELKSSNEVRQTDQGRQMSYDKKEAVSNKNNHQPDTDNFNSSNDKEFIDNNKETNLITGVEEEELTQESFSEDSKWREKLEEKIKLLGKY